MMLTLVRIILLSLLLFGVAADVLAADGEATIFTSTGKENARPVYSTDSSVREELRAFTDGSHPGLDQLKMLPSLSSEQRKKLDELYERLKTESQPLQQELQSLRPQLKEPMLKRAIAGARNGDTTFDDRVMSNVASLLIKFRDKRASAWQEVQSIISARQMEELALMRRGELRVGTLAAGGGSDASNLGDEDMPGMVGMPALK